MAKKLIFRSLCNLLCSDFSFWLQKECGVDGNGFGFLWSVCVSLLALHQSPQTYGFSVVSSAHSSNFSFLYTAYRCAFVRLFVLCVRVCLSECKFGPPTLPHITTSREVKFKGQQRYFKKKFQRNFEVEVREQLLTTHIRFCDLFRLSLQLNFLRETRARGVYKICCF